VPLPLCSGLGSLPRGATRRLHSGTVYAADLPGVEGRAWADRGAVGEENTVGDDIFVIPAPTLTIDCRAVPSRLAAVDSYKAVRGGRNDENFFDCVARTRPTGPRFALAVARN
jgi:hypothetical protein